MEARGFYAILAAATLIGLGLNFTAIDPVQALFWSAVINGMVAGPVMTVVMLLASNMRVMGRFVISFWLKLFGWVATAVMIIAAIGLFVTWNRT